MKQIIQGNMHRIEYIFIYFILLQPILDVFAYMELPIPEVIRVMAIGLGFLYLTFFPNQKIQKYTRFYHVLAFVYFLAHFITNWFIKDPFSLTLELTHMIKTFFFIELLLVYVCLLYSFSKRVDWQKIILRNVIISMAIISVIMLLASFTDTGKRTYDMLAKAGHTGWFFSGNELSAILVFGFGMTLLLMLKNKNRQHKLFIFSLLLVLIWSMMTVGTKVSYGGLLLLLSTAILIAIVNHLRTKSFPINVIILLPLLIGTILWTPYSAIGQNLNLTLTNQQKSEQDLADNVLIEEEGVGVGIVLSGRNEFMQETISQYKDAAIPQQLFGMGYGGNYQRDPKLIEMDFFDWFFGFGIIGIIILLIPVVSIGFYILRNLLQGRFQKIDMSMIMIGLSVCLGFGIAFVAGHVLSSPAASIYLALMIAYLYVLSNRLKQPNEGLD
ncbi:O-antigen ligase family protein [Paraliobacillus sediminis]|uniref:O-antigen ligase family protein n=1 Tax=Paraliobacillus sediminis TaxID=1885916 RepID=UPI000E3E80A5|nr:O-antigen ligase family protein [Paraliobacillus sediminis]